jgi:hypothetical protein
MLRHNLVRMADHPEGHRYEHYVRFGRTCPRNKPRPANAEETRYTWHDTGEPVWAVEIPHKGYSLTHLMYGADGRAYFMYKGSFYSAIYNRELAGSW